MALADPKDELLSFLQQEEQNSHDSVLDIERAAALSFYFGNPYGDEIEGRSALVTREVATVVDFDLISILRTCTSSQRIVEFEVDDVADKAAADDASRLIHYTFMRKQDGYRILQDWVKLGLLEKTGVVKLWVDQKSKSVTLDVPQEAFEENPDGSKYIDGNPVVSEPQHLNPNELATDEMGNPMPAPPIFRATVAQPLPPKFCVSAVPNEEFGASPDARDLDTAPYLFHAQAKSLSDLHKMGFQFDDDTLWGDNPTARIISDVRDSQRSKKDYDTNARRGSLRRVWLREEYCFYDMDGDGIAERIKVQRVGRQIFSIEPVDDQPFEEWCPYPMAARRVGQSLSDKCMDIQRVNSVLLRQGMDSLYMSTNPRTLVHEQSLGDNTIDDLLTVRSGALIRWTGANAPTPWTTAAVHNDAFQGMAQMQDMLESRTGISRLNQGLDENTFDRTATGTALMQTAGQTMQEYRARNFVEALRRLMEKMYRLMRKFGQPVQIVVDGKTQTIDPRTWPEEINTRVNVGLGTGSKDKRIAHLSQILETQNEAMAQGSPLVTPINMYNTTRALITDMDVGNYSDFVTEPPEQQEGQQQPKPDPEAIKAQGEAQATTIKAQSDHEQAMTKLSLQQQQQQAEAALKAQANDQDLASRREKNALDIQLAQQKAAFEASLASQQQNFEMSLAERRFQFDQEMARKKASQASESDSNITKYREGGSLDA